MIVFCVCVIILWFIRYWFSLEKPVNKTVDRQCVLDALPDTSTKTCTLPALSEWTVNQDGICD